VSWQAAILVGLAAVLVVGGVWFERSKPSARIIAAVAALAALGVAGRLIFAPVPNVVATTDIALITGYSLGGPPGFAVGALSALISNFWLGQGPWTPWQMAGWGMVGVGGAALAAMTGRRLGRWGLAAAAAVAAFAYGALLDLSVMVNFGGEQSLDRYLALSARSIPFNVAHAVGNAALMLAAGPALVRIVDRYRDRSEVEWEPRPASRRLAGGGIACVAIVGGLVLGLLGGPAAAPDRVSAATATLERGTGDAAAYLRSAQNDDGGYGISPGSTSNPGMTGWAVLGLEAIGINPLDVRSGGKTPIDFLRSDVGDIGSTGDLERTILALRGAGIGVTDFGGRNLISELRSRQSGNGSYEKQINLTAFAILARVAAGDSPGSLGKPAGWLRDAQNKDGGWGSVSGAPSEPDSTGAVLQALALTGADKPLAKGRRWLERNQNGDGGWSLVEGQDSNAQSTSWAVQGLISSGADPGSVRKGSRSGLDFLASRQASDGHYSYSKVSDQTPIWVTGQALTAIGGEPFPIAPVARAPKDQRGGGGDGSGNGDGGNGGGAGSGTGFGNGQGSSRGQGASNEGAKSGGADQGAGPAAVAEAARAAGAAEVQAELASGQPTALFADAEESPLPATPFLLGGLAVLAAAFVGGWFWYRRRLP
jgi:energy-coupling factor transport system substrate-specific component